MSNPPETYTGPGLVDLQVNAYAGFDFNTDPNAWTGEQLHAVRDALRRRGVTAVLPTLVTADTFDMIARAKRYRELIDADAELAADFPALHVEGPFISPVDGPRGAHPKCHCKLPAAAGDLIDRIRAASGGRVAIVTIAPELPGAIELIARCASEGIVVAMGHTQASDEFIARAVDAGARMSTHLGNGSHPMLPRLRNYVQTQLADDRLIASFIADGHHVPPATLKNFIRAKTPARSILVTDAMVAAELAPGRYEFAGQAVDVSPDGRAAAPGAPNLAGSVLTLDRAVLNTVRFCDVTFDQAWAMASTIPAALIGLDDQPQVSVRIGEQGFAAD